MKTRPVLLGMPMFILFLLRCSAAGGDDPAGTGGSNTAGTGGASGLDASADIIAPGGFGGGGSDGAVAPLTGEVYAHSDSTLYKLEPLSKSVSVIGDFDCIGASGSGSGMWDIAIDKDGNMFGSANGLSGASLVRVMKGNAHCEVVVTASSLPNSLAFIPAGILDPTDEVLVGFDRNKYVRIDKLTGDLQEIGSLNPNATGQVWESSGDIVSIIDDKTYATVKPYLGGTSYGTDTIVEVDPKTGEALRVIGNTGFYGLWGLGYWGGVAYGFSESGQLCEIDLTSGVGVQIPIPNLPADISFWGAGVTTAAPIDVPK
ncbi:MAG: hypothetical protein ACOC1F_14480 [Myxococcota bacterium]